MTLVPSGEGDFISCPHLGLLVVLIPDRPHCEHMPCAATTCSAAKGWRRRGVARCLLQEKQGKTERTAAALPAAARLPLPVPAALPACQAMLPSTCHRIMHTFPLPYLPGRAGETGTAHTPDFWEKEREREEEVVVCSQTFVLGTFLFFPLFPLALDCWTCYCCLGLGETCPHPTHASNCHSQGIYSAPPRLCVCLFPTTTTCPQLIL